MANLGGGGWWLVTGRWWLAIDRAGACDLCDFYILVGYFCGMPNQRVGWCIYYQPTKVELCCLSQIIYDIYYFIILIFSKEDPTVTRDWTEIPKSE